jgi:hypothetical protein
LGAGKMITVNVQPIKEESTYPVIKKHIPSGRVVLFIRIKTGISLGGTSSVNDVGYYSDIWAEQEFEVFQGTITVGQVK